MSIVTIIQEAKQIHPDYVIMTKVGKFYKVYGKDAYILSYLLQYKVKTEGKFMSLGFPDHSLKKVQSVLENRKINYLVLDSRTNYSIDEKQEFNNLNKYKEVYEKSKTYVNNQNRIERIYDYLMSEAYDDELKIKLAKIEEIIS